MASTDIGEHAPPTSRFRWSALAAVAITVLAWASAFVAIRYVGGSYRPGPLGSGGSSSAPSRWASRCC
jgi:hypothetical protein